MVNMEEISFSGQDYIGLFNAILAKKARVRFRANGFSMSPFIKDGDVLTFSPSFDTPVKAGEVAVFTHPETGKLVVHRIIGRRNGYYLSKGDNLCGADGFISKKDILGRVIKVERKGKRVFFGFGPERFLIAFLSKKNILRILFLPWRFVKSTLIKKAYVI